MNKQKDKKLQDQDSEVEEDEQEYQLSKRAQQMQQEVEELNKKIRYMELDFKKKEIEMNAELANEKQRVEELQDIVSKKLADIKENKESDELQMRLSQVEDELFEKQQIAHEMLRQLTDMEQENDYLKGEVERLRCSSPQLKPNQDIDVDKIVNTCMELQKHNDELQMEVEQIKRGAIDTIVEKEKVIIDLQEQLELITSNMKNMDDNYHNSNNQMLQEEIDNIRNEYEQRIQFYEERCQELNQRIEQDQLHHEEQLLNLEQQITERVFENMQQHIDSAKSVEADLIHQLQINEEKIRNQDKYISDSQKLLTNTREEYKKEKELNEQKIRNLSKQAEQYEEVNRLYKQITKEFEDYRKQSEREISEKQSQLEKLQQKRDEIIKIQVNLDSENKRLKENLENSKSSIRNLEEQSEQLHEQLEETQRDIHYKIKELSEKHEKEKLMIIEDFRNYTPDPYRKSSTASNLSNKIQSNEQVRQNTPQQARKDSYAFAQALERTQLNQFSLEFQGVKDQPKEIVSNESSGRKSTGGQRNSNANQTLLGLEFGDEDFNIEEEKTENIDRQAPSGDQFSTTATDGKDDNVYSPDTTPSNQEQQQSVGDLPEPKLGFQSSTQSIRKKKESFNIIESNTNPLLPQRNSTRNQFKKQFMFPPQQQSQMTEKQHQLQQTPPPKDALTYDQIARGYNMDNLSVQELVNENIDQKMKIQKLECSVNGLEVTIEKLQNEAKQTLKQLQEIRKEKVLTNKEADLIDELNSFKAHCHRVETQFVTQKLQLTEELHFYKEEVRVLEKTANDNREQLLKLSQDKDYFQQKYTKIRSILKQRRTGGSLGGDNIFADNYNLEITQQAQKKKTFWIFK